MAGQTSIQNGKKGGRKKGSKASHTLEAEAVKILYIEKAKEFALPMLNALVKKGLQGDVQAIKEFNDRVFGKAPQALTGPNGADLKIVFDSVFNDTTRQTKTSNQK